MSHYMNSILLLKSNINIPDGNMKNKYEKQYVSGAIYVTVKWCDCCSIVAAVFLSLFREHYSDKSCSDAESVVFLFGFGSNILIQGIVIFAAYTCRYQELVSALFNILMELVLIAATCII